MHEHVRKRRDLLAIFEQLRQIISDALRVDRVHIRHFHGNLVGLQSTNVYASTVDTGGGRSEVAILWILRTVLNSAACTPLMSIVKQYLNTFFAF